MRTKIPLPFLVLLESVEQTEAEKVLAVSFKFQKFAFNSPLNVAAHASANK